MENYHQKLIPWHRCLQLILMLSVLPRLSVAQVDTVSFNRDVRPILSDKCFQCHGPDAHDRQADLRLDTADGIREARDLIAPGNADTSELLRRITVHDPDEIMPPPHAGKGLSVDQTELIRRWIAQGAVWQPHWSFVTPQKPAIPPIESSWPENEIDRFILKRLEQNHLAPEPVADRPTLIRRVCLDLTGLPPSPDLRFRFSTSESEAWYEELIDELLSSPHYGEHMARFWLDAARYADTHGLHLDNYREMWLYRDWVIQAFNQNLSYREFLIEQLAGDLLDEPTDSQMIATGFNRAHVTTNEGGSIAEEVRVRNVVDRVSTTGAVFMGLTIGCAQCHDHKYDPLTQREFYQLYAFFNSLDANPMDGNVKDHAPVLRYFTPAQKEEMQALKGQVEVLSSEIEDAIRQFEYIDPQASPEDPVAGTAELPNPSRGLTNDVVWFDDVLPAGAAKTGRWTTADSTVQAPYSGQTSFLAMAEKFSQMFFLKAESLLRLGPADTLFTYVYLDPNDPPQQIMLQFHDRDWNHRAYWGENRIDFGVDGTTSRQRIGDLPLTGQWVRLEVPADQVGFKRITGIQGVAFSQYGGRVFWDTSGVATSLPQRFNAHSFRSWLDFQIATEGYELPDPLRQKLSKALQDRDHLELVALTDDPIWKNHYLRNINPDSRELIAARTSQLNERKQQLQTMTDSAPTTLIWKEKKNSVPARILKRGEYDQAGDVVERGTPAVLPEFSKELPANRLGLALWLADPQHPLTARVAVNRIWQQFFGTGLVATAEDFGAQGAVPTHPNLLDWLAVDFQQNGWDVKRLVKLLVTSATYRQQSRTPPTKLKVDPDNRLLSRGPRFRLDAETLRDQALAVGGLLVPKIGGPAVKPPQPDGLWFAVGYTRSNTVRFKKDLGSDKVHRRSIYTFWKRTAPPPQMSTFDAPSRESCILRRERTNTPLQALLLMNDPQYVEAARCLAEETLRDSLSDDDARIRFMFQRALARDCDEDSLAILRRQLDSSRDDFQNDPEGARQLISIGEQPAAASQDAIELAALTMLASLIMNTDEFVTRN